MTLPTLNRLPVYLSYLNIKQQEGLQYISSTVIAKDLQLNPVQVRKDLSLTGCVGKPRAGFVVEELIRKLKKTLGYNNTNDAILVGAGKLGKTLLSYEGFAEYGLNIVAAFDNNEVTYNKGIGGKQIFHINKMQDMVRRMNIQIGIITVSEEGAQEVCDQMVQSGISAIWNFAPVHLNVPKHIMLRTENLAASLAFLARHLETDNRNCNKQTIKMDWRDII